MPAASDMKRRPVRVASPVKYARWFPVALALGSAACACVEGGEDRHSGEYRLVGDSAAPCEEVFSEEQALALLEAYFARHGFTATGEMREVNVVEHSRESSVDVLVMDYHTTGDELLLALEDSANMLSRYDDGGQEQVDGEVCLVGGKACDKACDLQGQDYPICGGLGFFPWHACDYWVEDPTGALEHAAALFLEWFRAERLFATK